MAPLGKRFDHGGHLRGPSLRRHVFSLVKGDKKNPTLTGSKHSGFDTEVWRVWYPSLGASRTSDRAEAEACRDPRDVVEGFS